MAIPEPTLALAAQNVYSDVYIWWLTSSLRAKTIIFCETAAGIFPDADPKNQPCENALTVLWTLTDASTEPATARMAMTTASDIMNRLYKLLSLASYGFLTGGFVSLTQATALLDAFNSSYA